MFRSAGRAPMRLVGRTSAARGAPAQRPARSTAATVDEPAEEHEFVVVAGDETDLNDEIISANVEELGRMAFGEAIAGLAPMS